MLLGEARAIARGWVAARAAGDPHFRGAFFTGSTLGQPEDCVLPVWSDVDIVVVVAGSSAPAKPGKLACQGVVLEVTYQLESDLTAADAVAQTYYLAPSFASAGAIICDPTGRLALLHEHIAAQFSRPDAVARRYGDVLTRIADRLSAAEVGGTWAEQVLEWVFPTSLTTNVVIVAGLRNPTVRLRYLAARTVLREHDEAALYRDLLGLLGCADCDARRVQYHLDELARTFDQATAVAATPLPFSADITGAGRPIAIEGSQHLIDRGDHREAVFWIVATFARCQLVLATDSPARLRGEGERRLRAATEDLLGLRDTAGLLRRRDAVMDLLPALRRSAESIAGRRC